MAWLSQFKLGLPGSEITFELNPRQMPIEEGPLKLTMRNLAGDLKKSVVKKYVPMSIRINSNILTLVQKQQFLYLLTFTDFLSFQVRNAGFTMLERDLATDTTHVTIFNNSITLLDQKLVAGSFTANITITGVFDNPALTGTNYYTAGGGGSYDANTRIVTLGTALPGVQNCYVQYSYLGWLVDPQPITSIAIGGQVDIHSYDWELIGV